MCNDKKFEKTLDGAAEYYESIEKYEDRLTLNTEFEAAFSPEDIAISREFKFYRWIRDNKL